MGQVYLARDTNIHRKVALKYLTAEGTGERAAILREAQAAGRINHVNVAAIYHLVDAAGHTFMVMEYVEGESVARRLTRGRLPVREVISIGRQVAAGLAAAHAEGVIHRDIKPSNIQISRAGPAKILDFGVAKATASMVSTVTAAADQAATEPDLPGRPGTPAYMSPEQKSGLPVDERSDIYSLGLVLFEMATGRRPKSSEYVDGMFVTARPPRLDAYDTRIPEAFADIVERTLEPDPQDRFSSAAELEAALSALDPGRSPWGLSRHWRQGFGFLILSAAVASLVVVARARTDSLTAAAPLPIRSVAVLNLVNARHNPEEEYIAEGVTDGLNSALGQIGLKVICHQSSMQFKGSTKSVKQIAQELGVDAVIEGSVLSERDSRGIEHVRVSVSLIDPGTQTQIWNATFDRELGSLLALQTEIARTVAARLAGAGDPRLAIANGAQSASGTESSSSPHAVSTTGSVPGAGSANPDAVKLYLRGRQQWNERTVSSLREALDYFKQAVAIDQSYAPARAGLADVYALLAGNFGAIPRGEGAAAARENAVTAIGLDSNLAEAHASLGLTAYYLEWRWDDAQAEFSRAIDLNPSYAPAHQWYGDYLSSMGREVEGLAEAREALKLDPKSAIISRDVAWPLFFSRRYDAASQQLLTTLAQHPGYLPAERLLARTNAMNGHATEAVIQFEQQKDLEDTPRTRRELAWAYAVAGRTQDAEREFAAARGMPSAGAYEYDDALVLTALQKTDAAFDALNRAYEERDPTLVNLKHDPRLDALRSDSRYARLVALMRFP